MKKTKCKRCQTSSAPFNNIIFRKNFYLKSWFKINEELKKELELYDNKTVCQNCNNMLKDKIAVSDFQERRTEHLNIDRAYYRNIFLMEDLLKDKEEKQNDDRISKR